MSIFSAIAKCRYYSDNKKFGLYDEPAPSSEPARIDLKNGAIWIAIVVNEPRYDVEFVAIDKCINLIREDGKMAKRCDGALIHDSTIIFVELKERGAKKGNEWVKEAEEQLLSTIRIFQKTDEAGNFITKKAYIANSEHPKFKASQIRRMDHFFEETGYVLRIENRIIL